MSHSCFSVLLPSAFKFGPSLSERTFFYLYLVEHRLIREALPLFTCAWSYFGTQRFAGYF